MVKGRAGFSLIEALIACTLGSLVGLLVLGTITVQVQLQLRIEESVARQTVSDAAASLVTEEMRQVTRSSLYHADPDSLAFRRPLMMGQFCASAGGISYMYFPLEGVALETAKIAGYATVDAGGAWQYFDVPWAEMGMTFSTTAAATCAARGADTTKASTSFASVAAVFAPGTTLALYQKRQLWIGASALDPTSRGLFVAGTGETSQEIATGLDWNTRVSYRHRNGTLLVSPSDSDLPSIVGMRFIASATGSGRPGADAQLWTVDLWFPNSAF